MDVRNSRPHWCAARGRHPVTSSLEAPLAILGLLGLYHVPGGGTADDLGVLGEGLAPFPGIIRMDLAGVAIKQRQEAPPLSVSAQQG